MRKCFIISGIILLFFGANAQSGAVEQYYYTRNQGADAMMTPIAHITTSNNWYGEARYNFDELNTFSLYGGKKFSGGEKFAWEATPIVGGLMGQMTGGSVGMNMGFDFKRLFFSSQSQYSFSLQNNTDKYFYNWSELGFEATRWLYAGIALQQTNIYRETGKVEPGCMVGFSIKNWTIPLYAFNTAGQERYYVLGVNWQWESTKKNKKEQVLTSEPNNYKFE